MNKLSNLKARADMFRRVRAFFHEKNVLEVDCPSITQGAPIDLHIDLFPVQDTSGLRYLHTSPEYCMKRLLADGIGDIYQLGHVYRQAEIGHKHNPEFTMCEWYRLGLSFEEMIEETLEFIRLFLGNVPSVHLSYREAILKFTGLDYVRMTNDELFQYLLKENVEMYEGIQKEGKDALLNLLIAEKVEPHLGHGVLSVLKHYPASQAALARTLTIDDEAVAERFEIYFSGIELANGYHELKDSVEQKGRFEKANLERVSHGKSAYPIDHFFLKALEKGLPDCTGVAVGFDRLMMLKQSAKHIKEVIPFSWSEA